MNTGDISSGIQACCGYFFSYVRSHIFFYGEEDVQVYFFLSVFLADTFSAPSFTFFLESLLAVATGTKEKGA